MPDVIFFGTLDDNQHFGAVYLVYQLRPTRSKIVDS